jgi:hypothetical protein
MAKPWKKNSLPVVLRLKTIFSVSGRVCHGINVCISVAEPHHFYAAPASGENFDAAPAPAAPAPAPTLLHSKAKLKKK